jgi:lysophospholipase L1-like esterase
MLKRLAGGILRLGLVLIFTLAGVELALRAAGWGILTLRSREANKLGPNAVRILFIGESTTFGLGVRPEQAYPAVLTRMLEKRHPGVPFQGVNRGVPGVVTASMLMTLPDNLARYRPNLVVVQAGANDFNERLNGIEPPGRDGLPGPVSRALQNLRLYKSARLALELRKPGMKFENGQMLYYRHGASQNILYDQPRDEAKVVQVSRRLKDNLARIVALCRQAGARVVFAGYMHSPEENRILREAARENSVTFADCAAPNFRPAPELLNSDGWHPSPAGRSEERRVGKECRRLCRSRWSPYH